MKNKYKSKKYESKCKTYSLEIIGYNIISLCLKCLAVYPLSKTVEKFWIRVYSLLWWFYLLNHVVFFNATAYAFFSSIQDVISLSYSLMECLCVLECIILLIHLKVQGPRLRNLLTNARVQVNRKKPVTILENSYTYSLVISLIAVIYIISISMYANKPKILQYRKYFTQARYPFEIDSRFVDVLIWCHQSIAVLHMFLITTSDATVVLLLYSCTVQFKILEFKIKKGRREKLKAYIQEHNSILLSVEETNLVVRIVVIKTVFCFMTFSISTGIQLLHKNAVISQLILQVFIMIIVSLRFYVCAESAENMISSANSIGIATYFTPWHEEKLKFLIAKLIIIRRCQSLPKIYLSGFMSKLDRQYLGAVAYATYSYFTMIRSLVYKYELEND